MAILVLSAIGIGIHMYIYYRGTPMFENPTTIVEHFARPIFIGMLATVLMLALGTLFIHLVTVVPLKRISFFRMELEFDTAREKQIANQFLYTSTMLQNHTDNVKYLLENNLIEFKQVLQFLADSYKNSALEYNDELTLEVDVINFNELAGRKEGKLFNAIKKQSPVKSNTIFRNRLINGENLLVGSISVSDTQDLVMVVRRGYEHPFDIYDQETIESILGYATVLFDTVIMIQIMTKNNLLG